MRRSPDASTAGQRVALGPDAGGAGAERLVPGVSIIVPALNEAANIAAAVTRCVAAASRHFSEYEVIVVDDGSTDETGEIAEALALGNARVRVVHHDRPRNLGYAYRHGVALARFDHVLMFPGDDEGSDQQLDAVLGRAGAADIVVNYISNPEVRPWTRRALSRAFVALMNALFGLRLRYYNGTVLHRTALARAAGIETDSFAYQAEALVKLLRRGHTYVEVGTPITPRAAGRSKALRIRNALAVGSTLLRLLSSRRAE